LAPGYPKQFKQLTGRRSRSIVLVTGRPEEFVKKSPKMLPTRLLVKSNTYITLTIKKSSLLYWATSVIFQKFAKEKRCPRGENSPNLVTLLGDLLPWWVFLRLRRSVQPGDRIGRIFATWAKS
jgi:hypothetical protein